METKQANVIYLLEDNEDLSEVLSDLINTVGGFQTMSFKGDGELLQTLQKDPPLQIVMNLQTPAERRLQLIREIRQFWPTLPLLVLTIQNPAPFQKMLDGDAKIRFLKKPFALEEFQSALESGLPY